MNDTINIIKNRRSIRQFKPQPVPDAVLQDIMECTILAPNAMCQQKWHFSVIRNRDVITYIK